jgi:hypothetical protein
MYIVFSYPKYTLYVFFRLKEDEELQSRQGLESIVKELQKELSDRDNVISQLYEQMSVTSFQTSPINSPYVMSPGTRSPGDRSPDADKTPPLGCSVDSVASSFFAANYKSSLFTDKDNKIIELTESNIDLERKLLDMEENLRAKEELVRVRTAAVTLMSADLSAKGKSTLDKLEDTRIEMRKMQSNFAEQESQWREKNSCLAVELEIKDKKIATIEDSLDRMEKVRLRYSQVPLFRYIAASCGYQNESAYTIPLGDWLEKKKLSYNHKTTIWVSHE